MRDPFTWSVPLGRLFGITVRVHVLFLVVASGLVLQWAFKNQVKLPFADDRYHDVPAGAWIDMAVLMGLLFLSVLAHEFGHCAGARLMDGDAHEILLWPLGGLASVEVPHTPRANFVTTLCGPLVNLLICLGCGIALFLVEEHLQPPWNPFTWSPIRLDGQGTLALFNWQGVLVRVDNFWIGMAARLFYINWLLFWLNVLLIGFPMDGGRLFQCLMWPRLGFHQATMTAVYAGFVTMLVVAIFAIAINDLMPMCLAMFIGISCWRQWIVLVSGGEESLLGYDFSQGYTSLERDQPPERRRRRRRPNVLQRWLQRRAARRHLREQEQREAEELRMDQLLEKVQREGLHALTDEERRFLKRVSDKYRNRQ